MDLIPIYESLGLGVGLSIAGPGTICHRPESFAVAEIPTAGDRGAFGAESLGSEHRLSPGDNETSARPERGCAGRARTCEGNREERKEESPERSASCDAHFRQQIRPNFCF